MTVGDGGIPPGHHDAMQAGLDAYAEGVWSSSENPVQVQVTRLKTNADDGLHSRKTNEVVRTAYEELCRYLGLPLAPHRVSGNILRTQCFSVKQVLEQEYKFAYQQADVCICLSIACAQSEFQNQQNGLDPCG